VIIIPSAENFRKMSLLVKDSVWHDNAGLLWLTVDPYCFGVI